MQSNNTNIIINQLSKLWRQYPVYRDGLTLLVDDTPEKARKNPPFTAIHPREWSREMRDDEGLGEGGGVRRYLERLADAFESSSSPREAFKVEEYVRRNAFIETAASTSLNGVVERESDDEEEEDVRRASEVLYI